MYVCMFVRSIGPTLRMASHEARLELQFRMEQLPGYYCRFRMEQLLDDDEPGDNDHEA